jgi:dipeptidyl-peptidase-4
MQKLATLSPDGKKVAFVHNNNLYIKDIYNDCVVQITHDGLQNQVINGAPDWVYEEEFALKTGFQWSPDSKKIAYYRFDESEVKQYQLTFYDEIYPTEYSYKFPKAGEANSLVDIFVYELDSGNIKKMYSGDETDRYIPRIKWLPNSTEICILNLNRQQNVADYYIAGVETGESRIFHTATDKKYLLEFNDDFIHFPDSNQALILSDRDGYQHIYRYGLNGELINQVTKGSWEVDDFLGFDSKEQKIYYSSNEKSPLQKHVYVIGIDGTGKKALTHREGNDEAIFSGNLAYFVLSHSDANTPYEVAIYNKEGELVRNLEDNLLLKQLISDYGFSRKEFFTFLNRQGDTIYGYRILPPDFNQKNKYPVLVYAYGGPEAQYVVKEWNNYLPWHQLFAQQGYIVVCIDNRGTDGRGSDFKKSIYMQLGKLETEDHIDLVKYLRSFSYIDSERIGIFGWSYGGYLSLLCITKAAEYFKMAIAVAPVTNWRFYDTVYTERYMRKPQDNAEGYDLNSPINFTHLFKGKLLLIHGMTDDNVHLQNSAEFIKSLVSNNKQFDMQFYPDKNHFLYGGNTTYHLYTRMTNYILQNL